MDFIIKFHKPQQKKSTKKARTDSACLLAVRFKDSSVACELLFLHCNTLLLETKQIVTHNFVNRIKESLSRKVKYL